MGDRFLTDLVDVCRVAGLPYVEYTGWQTRARGSGGYDTGRPTHVMCHHTASPPSASGENDASYCAEGDEDAPLSNLYLDRSGVVWILAAGATNTNGKGHDWWGGGVPDDAMNTYAIGIEANGGYGEPWPRIQQDAYIVLCCALCSHYGIDNNCVRGHAEWAPDRKVDPAGESEWSPDTGTWDMDAYRRSCVENGDDMPLSDEDVERVAARAAELVWSHDVGGTRAWNAINIIQGTVRQFLGGWKDGKPPPERTLLQQIFDNTEPPPQEVSPRD